jgi:hypothetical protein
VTSGVPESVGLLPPLVLPPQHEATPATAAAAGAKPQLHWEAKVSAPLRFFSEAGLDRCVNWFTHGNEKL